MAPPGVNSFYDHLDTIMTFGSCFSPFSSSYKSSLMSPSSLKQATLSPMSSRSFSYGMSVIHADHDYVIKPVHVSSLSVEDTDDTATCPEGRTSACAEEGSCPAPGSDAMLSSAAYLENTGDDNNITDTDFLQDLDSIDFSLTDLDPCSDMAMEDSFQEFIDSALDKSPTTFYNDEEAALQRETDAVIYNKDDFFHLLGLRPVGHKASTPTSSPSHVLDVVPTKKSSCSGAETFSSIVYSTAHNKHHHVVQTSPSTQGAQRNRAPSSPQVLLIPSFEPMTPLTIDTSFDISPECPEEFYRQANDVTMVENSSESCQDSDTHEFLKWLHDDANEHKSKDANNNEIYSSGLLASMETGNSRKAVESDLDLESFIDLDDYITDSTTSSPEVAVTLIEQMNNSVAVVHRNNEDHFSDLKLSFLSELSDRFHDNEKLKNDASGFDVRIKTLHQYRSPQGSPLNSHPMNSQAYQTWLSSGSASPAHSPSSLKSMDPLSVSHLDYHEGTHLAMLDLFSEENAPALLHIEMSDQDIRFM